MALSKITTNSLADSDITSAKIADDSIVAGDIAPGAVNKAELDVASSSGTGAAVMPTGTTGQRPTAVQGQIRFNTTLNLMEYYDGANWKSIDSPPVLTSISGTINENTDSTITINGSNFQSGAVVYVVGAAVSGTDRALTTTFSSQGQVTAATNATAVNYVGGASFDIKVINPSSLSGTLSAAGAVDRDPTWTTSSGSLGNIWDSGRGSVSFTVVATDPESTSVTYAVTTGSLPSGLSLSSSTGVISGSTSGVGSDTTTTFSITPTSNGQAGIARSFSITQRAPVITSFTTVTSSTFSVPTGLTTMQVLVVAGGGGGGGRAGGGGGAGGIIEHPSFPVTPGGTVSYTLGGGGSGAPGTSGYGTNGSNSVFGSLTAIGGGGGGDAGDIPSNPNGVSGGQPGGSGGGAGYDGARGIGVQPSQPGNSGTYGYGYPGGYGTGNPNNPGTNFPNYNSGGGGGAGAVGSNASDSVRGNGGNGRTSSISGSAVTYGGGGGGGDHVPATPAGGTGGTGGGGNAGTTGIDGPGSPGTDNRGGGGGGGSSDGGPGGSGGNGGSGIIIIKY